ncbi:MAG: hypothetical protein A4E70_02589 [Syntrophus sp. PtaU1.Bin005]|nr:MAG: hypothetical protein A4E70_02589 [Syntrophus sp. PtaU1.Bin005]
MIVIRNVIEIDQAAHHVILEACLLDAAAVQCQYFCLRSAEVLNPKLISDSRIFQGLQGERKRFEARLHFPFRRYENARNVDGLFGDQVDSFGHDSGDIRLFRHSFQFRLSGLALFLHRLYNGCLNLRFLQGIDIRDDLRLIFQLTDHVPGDLRHALLLRFRKRLNLVLSRQGCTSRRLLRFDPQFRRQIRLRYHRDRLLPQRRLVQHDGLQPDCRIGAVGLVDDFLKLVVGDDVQTVHGHDAGPFAVGQAEAPADGLFNEDAGIGRPEGNDGIEVRYVPSFFEHVDVNDDLRRFRRRFHLEQAFDHLRLFPAGPAGVHLNDLVPVSSLKEGVRVRPDQLHQLACMGRIAGNHQQERLHDGFSAFPRIGLQFHFHAFMQPDAILQLQPFDLLGRHAGRAEILTGHDGRLLHKPVRHRLAQGIVVNDVLEGNRPAARFHERRGGQFQAQDRFQLIDGPHPGAGPVTVRFVHEQHQVRQARQVIEIALADIFGKALDAGRFPAAHLGVDLGDVEDVDLAAQQGVEERDRRTFVIVAGDDRRGVRGKFRDALEHVFRRVGREIGDELVVDGEVRREDEEVVDAVGQVQVADEGPHEPRFPDAGREGKAQRGKVPLEIRHGGKLALDGRKLGAQNGLLARRGDLHDAVQNFQGKSLRRTQAQAAGNGVHVSVHCSPPSSKRSPCSGGEGALGRFSTRRL